ncbi:MAG: hypothetical protein KatS3mg051_2102 [Anaerolineae bacterium]|nr:MAG: hypothetical protein KatS3mg051_2102 [Anaerolineae bacterium]
MHPPLPRTEVKRLECIIGSKVGLHIAVSDADLAFTATRPLKELSPDVRKALSLLARHYAALYKPAVSERSLPGGERLVCDHAIGLRLARKVKRNGQPMYYVQCVECGARGSEVKRTLIRDEETVPLDDGSIAAAWEKQFDEAWRIHREALAGAEGARRRA